MDGKKGRPPMTRGEQTGWIIGVMILLAFVAWRYVETKDNPCARMFGSVDQSCEAQMAAQRIIRGY